MNIGNILNRRLGLITVPNLQRVVNNLLETIGFVDGALPDSRPYKVYTAILFQYGSDAPVATVLESTLSNAVSWVRTEAGVYNIGGNTEISNGVLVSHRSLNFSTNVGVGYILSFNGAELYTQRSDNLNYSDNLLDSTLIEIRVYN